MRDFLRGLTGAMELRIVYDMWIAWSGFGLAWSIATGESAVVIGLWVLCLVMWLIYSRLREARYD